MSNEIKDGGPAFPRSKTSMDYDTAPQNGMDLRDYFAAAALQGEFATQSDGCFYSVDSSNAMLMSTAEMCYRMADAMLAAREKKQSRT